MKQVKPQAARASWSNHLLQEDIGESVWAAQQQALIPVRGLQCAVRSWLLPDWLGDWARFHQSYLSNLANVSAHDDGNDDDGGGDDDDSDHDHDGGDGDAHGARGDGDDGSHAHDAGARRQRHPVGHYRQSLRDG